MCSSRAIERATSTSSPRGATTVAPRTAPLWNGRAGGWRPTTSAAASAAAPVKSALRCRRPPDAERDGGEALPFARARLQVRVEADPVDAAVGGGAGEAVERGAADRVGDAADQLDRDVLPAR